MDLKTHLPGCWHLSSHSPSDACLWFSPLDLPVLSQPHGLRLQRPEERQPAPSALRGLTLPGHTLQEAWAPGYFCSWSSATAATSMVVVCSSGPGAVAVGTVTIVLPAGDA